MVLSRPVCSCVASLLAVSEAVACVGNQSKLLWTCIGSDSIWLLLKIGAMLLFDVSACESVRVAVCPYAPDWRIVHDKLCEC